jgi:hypothetical protein
VPDFTNSGERIEGADGLRIFFRSLPRCCTPGDIDSMRANHQNLRSARNQQFDTTEKENIMIQPSITQQCISHAVRAAAIGFAVALIAVSAMAQTARDTKGATPLVAIENEAPAKLIVDPPIPEQLALGRVFIQYRTENLRILPVFGKAALEVSPRIGHLHYYLDDQSWPTVDTSGETVVFVGLPPGPHKVRLQLADAIHRPIPNCSKVVEFTVPPPKPQ